MAKEGVSFKYRLSLGISAVRVSFGFSNLFFRFMGKGALAVRNTPAVRLARNDRILGAFPKFSKSDRTEAQ